MFKAVDPGVEAKLAGSVAGLFLRHLAAEEVPRGEAPPPPPRSGRDRVSADQVEAFVRDLMRRPPAPPPRLGAHLTTERLWILSDLATNGTGLSRLRATTELRAFIDGLARDGGGGDADTLLELVDMIRAAHRQDGVSVLMHVLMLAAAQALDRLDRSTEIRA